MRVRTVTGGTAVARGREGGTCSIVSARRLGVHEDVLRAVLGCRLGTKPALKVRSENILIKRLGCLSVVC